MAFVIGFPIPQANRLKTPESRFDNSGVYAILLPLITNLFDTSSIFINQASCQLKTEEYLSFLQKVYKKMLYRLRIDKYTNQVNVNNKEIGFRLASFRKAIGVSQQEVANKAELNRAYLTQIETGRTNPSFKLMFQLMITYNLSIDWLLSGKGQMFIVKEEDILNRLKPIHQELLEKLDNLVPEQEDELIKGVIQIIRSIK